MLIGITNEPRDYAWGSTTAIAELLGRTPSGGPEAELWLGAHPAAPSVVTTATPALAGRRLDDLIAEDPAAMLGPGRDRLPFLMKVLAADHPLSLQAHPDPDQAKAGFAREQEAGLAADDPARNYRDASDKPEIVLALSPTFEALAGFRHVSESRLLLSELAMFAGTDGYPIQTLVAKLAGGDPARAGSTGSSRDVGAHGMPESGTTVPSHDGEGNPLADAVRWLLEGGDDVEQTVAAVVAAATRATANSSFAREWATVRLLAAEYPGDPGIVISLLMNRISLPQGQVLGLPAGDLHAYLAGLGIEVMAASDNVLRGGLTAKHVDVEELLDVVRFEALPSPTVGGARPDDALTVFRPPAGDFVLVQVGLGDAAGVHGYTLSGPEQAELPLTGPAIVLCVAGGLRVEGTTGTMDLARGDAAYITPDEGPLTLSGSAIAYLTTTP